MLRWDQVQSSQDAVTDESCLGPWEQPTLGGSHHARQHHTPFWGGWRLPSPGHTRRCPGRQKCSPLGGQNNSLWVPRSSFIPLCIAPKGKMRASEWKAQTTCPESRDLRDIRPQGRRCSGKAWMILWGRRWVEELPFWRRRPCWVITVLSDKPLCKGMATYGLTGSLNKKIGWTQPSRCSVGWTPSTQFPLWKLSNENKGQKNKQKIETATAAKENANKFMKRQKWRNNSGSATSK